jgi:hypothetical protein
MYFWKISDRKPQDGIGCCDVRFRTDSRVVPVEFPIDVGLVV